MLRGALVLLEFIFVAEFGELKAAIRLAVELTLKLLALDTGFFLVLVAVLVVFAISPFDAVAKILLGAASRFTFGGLLGGALPYPKR